MRVAARFGLKDHFYGEDHTMSIENGWYYAKGSETVGPMTRGELIAALPNVGGLRTLVYGPGLTAWTEARHVGVLASTLEGARSASVPPPSPTGRRMAHEIDYEIIGDDMQYVEIELDPGETVVAEAGGMMYMDETIQMDTVFGDPSREGGFFSKLLDAGKRMLTQESLFLTTFTGGGAGKQRIAFAAPYPGSIVALDLATLNGEMICQKDAFLCAAKGVRIGVAFHKRIGAGLFGGEGFILQKLIGDGLAFVHAGGTLCKHDLRPGQRLKVDTGCLVAFQPSVDYDIQFVGGIKNTFFGGEGVFFATLTGPGQVWLQSLPFSRLAGRMIAAAGPRKKGEGNTLLGGLGQLLDGDND